ncbi:MAG: hypothetical protein ACREXR_04390 [Gammaproteobacteria bacterium]
MFGSKEQQRDVRHEEGCRDESRAAWDDVGGLLREGARDLIEKAVAKELSELLAAMSTLERYRGSKRWSGMSIYRSASY